MTNQLGNLGNYGVAELLRSVHPIGKPIIHSTNCGVGRTPRIGLPISRLVKQSFRSFPSVGFVKPLLFRGVGNNPDSISWMGRTNPARRYAVPLRIIPDLGQRPENGAKPVIKQLCDVLHDKEARSKLANKADHFEPKPAPLASKAGPRTCGTDILTGKSPSDCVHDNVVAGEGYCGKTANIIIDGNLWPNLAEARATFRIDLAERHGFKPARALKAKAEPPDAAEQVEQPEFAPPTAADAGRNVGDSLAFPMRGVGGRVGFARHTGTTTK